MTLSSTHTPDFCDLLIEGGLVLTFDIDGTVIADGAVAIRRDRVVAVGTRDELAARFAPSRRLSGRDKIIMPGLINTHNHTPLMIVRGMAEDMGFAPAYMPTVPQGHRLSKEECYALSRLGVYELLRFGSTTVVDYYRHPEACARALSEAGIRGFVGGRIHDADAAMLSEGHWQHDRKTGQATLQETADLFQTWHGKHDGRIQCIIAPHAPDTCTPDLLREVRGLAELIPVTVHTHLAQSEDEIRQVRAQTNRSPAELLEEVGLLNDRLIAAHCIWLDQDEITRVGQAKVNVAHAPIGNAKGGMAAPVSELQRAGANITLCTDSISGDLFEAMRLAISITRLRGAGYSVKAADVAAWSTRHGAAALGMDDQIGILANGYKADIVILDALAPNLSPIIDGVGIVVHSGTGANVDTVLVDGQILLEGGRPTLFDGDEVVKEAQAVATRLWERSGFTPVDSRG